MRALGGGFCSSGLWLSYRATRRVFHSRRNAADLWICVVCVVVDAFTVAAVAKTWAAFGLRPLPLLVGVRRRLDWCWRCCCCAALNQSRIVHESW